MLIYLVILIWGEVVFHDRKQALDKVLAAEANNKKKISEETFYEEY